MESTLLLPLVAHSQTDTNGSLDGGAYATGGSLALDDSYALYLALHHTIPDWQASKPSTQQLQKALKLYEDTRRPHTDKLLYTVLASKSVQPPKDDEELRQRMLNRASTLWLSEHDVVRTFSSVVTTQAGRESTVAESRL